jgi:hypothetical protein
MSAQTVFDSLVARGATVTAEDGVLYVAPRSVLTDSDRTELKRFKPELLTLLSGCEISQPDAPAPESTLEPKAHSATVSAVAHAEQMMRVANTFPGAKPLKRGRWRIDGETYTHDEAVRLVAHTLGTTTNGTPVSIDAGAEHRKEQRRIALEKAAQSTLALILV